MAQRPSTGVVLRSNRRHFLTKCTSTLAAAGALAGGLSIGRSAHAAGSDTLKIGLIGCGGRGTGAGVNALGADKNCKLVALTWEQAISSQESLAPAAYTFDATPPILPDKDGKYPIAVPGETKFV